MPKTDLENAIFRETDTLYPLESYHQNQVALVLLIGQCNNLINIYSHTLCPQIFNTPLVIEACERFCLKNHRTKINILINESRPITRISHRLLGLSHRHSSSIFFKKVNPIIENREDDFVCFDKSAFFQLPNHLHYAAICNFADASRTSRFLSYFNDAWDRSETDPELRAMSL